MVTLAVCCEPLMITKGHLGRQDRIQRSLLLMPSAPSILSLELRQGNRRGGAPPPSRSARRHPPMASLLRLQAFAPALNVPRNRCFLSPLGLASAATAPLARRLSTAASTSSPEPPSSEPVIPSPNPSDA